NNRDCLCERVIQKEPGCVRFEIGRQYAARLQIGHLTRGERNQFADAFVKSRRGTEAKQVWDLRPGIGFEIIAVAQLVMRGEKPSRVRLHALKRTNVVLKIDM